MMEKNEKVPFVGSAVEVHALHVSDSDGNKYL